MVVLFPLELCETIEVLEIRVLDPLAGEVVTGLTGEVELELRVPVRSRLLVVPEKVELVSWTVVTVEDTAVVRVRIMDELRWMVIRLVLIPEEVVLDTEAVTGEVGELDGVALVRTPVPGMYGT